jgi:hypothetical protein
LTSQPSLRGNDPLRCDISNSFQCVKVFLIQFLSYQLSRLYKTVFFGAAFRKSWEPSGASREAALRAISALLGVIDMSEEDTKYKYNTL